MTMYLFFDTETSGLPNKRLPLNHPDQPHIVQLAAILTDGEGVTQAELNLRVRLPKDAEIHPRATEAHGVTTEQAWAFTISIYEALRMFRALADAAPAVCCHNTAFDIELLRIAYTRVDMRNPIDEGNKRQECTMRLADAIMQLPPSPRMVEVGFTKPKPPSLQEAHRYFLGRDFEGAHDALADVRACRDVFFAIQRHREAA